MEPAQRFFVHATTNIMSHLTYCQHPLSPHPCGAHHGSAVFSCRNGLEYAVTARETEWTMLRTAPLSQRPAGHPNPPTLRQAADNRAVPDQTARSPPSVNSSCARLRARNGDSERGHRSLLGLQHLIRILHYRTDPFRKRRQRESSEGRIGTLPGNVFGRSVSSPANRRAAGGGVAPVGAPCL